MHGAFFIGIVLMIIFACFESFKLLASGKIKNEYRYIACLILTSFLLVAVSFVNPYGVDLWKFIFDSATTTRPYLSEWAPFNLISNFTDHTDFIALSLVSISVIFFSGKQRDATWMCILFVAFLGALLLRRNIPIFAIITCFVIPEHLENVIDESLGNIQNKIPQHLPLFLLCLLIPLSTWFTLAANKINPMQIEVPQDRFPIGVISFIKENNIKGNMLVFFDWTEYCIWKLYPDCRVFLDGRFTDAYSHETVTDYFAFLYSEKNWENILKKYPVDILLLPKGNSTYNMMVTNKDSPLYKKSLVLEQWKLVCEDKIAGLFLKTDNHSNTIANLNLSQPIVTNSCHAIYFP
ncbi:MAG: hypothetical protein PHR77_18965 [Kiritimatiellae bacterium]|nr:hypothetical protein [Kiritimatiellia bacterium]MDD5522841.1 hypothetical protein [Kiritimatiellia bacterium]